MHKGNEVIAPKRFLPSTSQLLAFEAVARHRSVSAAARELSVTQGAVSRQIQQLERQLGMTLFERHRKRIYPSEAGSQYADEIRGALKQIANASLKLQANPDGGVLNLAILPTFGTHWLAPRLADFLNTHAGITINLSTRLAPFDFDSDTVDAAIHFGAADWPEAHHLKLMDESVLPVCSPTLYNDANISVAKDLLRLPLLHLETRANAWLHWLLAHGVNTKPSIGMMFDQFATMSKAAVHGAGVALLPEFLIRNELADGSLIAAYGGPTTSLGSYYLTWPSSKSNYRPLTRFKDWLHSEIN